MKYLPKVTSYVEAMQYPGLRELKDANEVLCWLDSLGITHRHDGGLIIDHPEDGDLPIPIDNWIIYSPWSRRVWTRTPKQFDEIYEAYEEVPA